MAKKAKARATFTWRKQKVRDRWQIALYVPEDLEKALRAEAIKRQRAYSATVCEILEQYFRNRKLETEIVQHLNEVPPAHSE